MGCSQIHNVSTSWKIVKKVGVMCISCFSKTVSSLFRKQHRLFYNTSPTEVRRCDLFVPRYRPGIVIMAVFTDHFTLDAVLSLLNYPHTFAESLVAIKDVLSSRPLPN